MSAKGAGLVTGLLLDLLGEGGVWCQWLLEGLEAMEKDDSSCTGDRNTEVGSWQVGARSWKRRQVRGMCCLCTQVV